MALKFTDGFDHYLFGNIGLKWDYYQNIANWDSDTFMTGRLGTGQALQLNHDTGITIYKSLPTSHATNIVGVAFMVSQTQVSEQGLIRLQDVATGDNILELRLTTSMTLRLIRGGNTQLGSVSGTLQAGRWYYLEMKSVIHGSTGVAELRIDGVTAITFTGNTQPGSATTANRLYLNPYFSNNQNGHWFAFDDLYWLDGSGTSNTGYLGDVRIVVLNPTAESGDTDFTLIGGAVSLHARILADSPDHYWPLQDAAGTTTFTDQGLSATPSNLAFVGTTIPGNGVAGVPGFVAGLTAVNVNGNGGVRLQANHVADLTLQSDWTIAMLIHASPVTSESHVYDKGGTTYLRIRSDNSWSLRFSSNISDVYNVLYWNQGQWDMYHFVKSGGTLYVYRGGVLAWSVGYSVGATDTAALAFMGDRGGGSLMSGSISHIAVWSRALSATEVARQYAAATGASDKPGAVRTYDGDAIYVQSSTVNQAETFDFDDVATSVQVVGVVLNTFARKDDAGFRSITGLARVSGTDYENSLVAPLGTTYVDQQFVYEVNPATGVAWTVAEINSAKFGVKVKV
jgi:hypothetical protein